MRPDIGLSTIATRIAGMRSIAAPPTAQSAPASDTAFADALNGQLQAQTSAAEAAYTQASMGQTAYGQTTYGQTTYGQTAYGQAGLAGMGTAQLGPGVQLTGGGGLITPQLPGTAAVGHSCPECQPGGVSAATVGLGGAAAGAATGTRTGPPAELQAYGNGRIPAAALQPLGIGDHSLWAPAAQAFTDMNAAAARDGVDIGVNSSYRSYDRQVEMVERYGLYSQGGRAASPGSSNHGWGVSMDLQLDNQAQQWMRANGATYGFVEDVAREPWHWTFTAASY